MLQRKKIRTDTVTNNYIDSETNEIIETDIQIKHQHIVVENSCSFVMEFVEIMGLKAGLDSATIKVLTWCVHNTVYNKNIVTITKFQCNEITELFGIKYQSIHNSLTTLKRKKILIPTGIKCSYRVNPRYYWRGELNERKKVMQFILTVECLNC
jgi:hypothetical protein